MSLYCKEKHILRFVLIYARAVLKGRATWRRG